MIIDLGGLAYTPLPSLGVHSKFKLFGFELGVKVAGVPPYALSGDTFSANVQNMVIGGKLRYEIVDKKLAVVQFGVSAGGFYDYTKGNLGLTMNQSSAVYEDVDSDGTKEYIADVLNTNTFDTSWKGHTLGGEVQGNMKVLFLNLFAGGRLSTSWGKANTNISGDVTITPVGGYTVESPSESIDVSTEAAPSGFDFYGFGGIEAKIFPLVLGLRGGYNFSNNVIALDFGARLQF
jgi:hypothetical protein